MPLTPDRRPPSRPSRTALGSVLRGVALACFGLHVVLLAVSGGRELVMVLPMLALSSVCLLCARSSDAAGKPRARDLMVIGSSGALMVVWHLGLVHHLHLTVPGDGSVAVLVDLLMHAGVGLALGQAGLAVYALAALPGSARSPLGR